MPTVLVTSPSADVYGSDLQMLESVRALRADGYDVVVATGDSGPLQERLHELGAQTLVVGHPVLKRADATPSGVLRLAVRALRAYPAMRRVLRRVDPDLVYVNTLTLPWWLVAARVHRVPTLCHAHEAEPEASRVVQKAMSLPLLLADRVIANSGVSRRTICAAVPRLEGRTSLIHNGVPGPPEPPLARPPSGTVRLVVVGRLSPLKAPHVAVDALARLRAGGLDARLELCGSAVPGKEDYEEALHDRVSAAGLDDVVTFSGYSSPIWSALERADVLLATSTSETFGNAVVEAQLALRPVVATAVGGHLETVVPERTGLLAPVGDDAALARQVERLTGDPALVAHLVSTAHDRAVAQFSPAGYGEAVVAVVATHRRRAS